MPPEVTTDPGDGALLARPSAESFTQLYRRHADAVWNHARRSTTSPGAAEEVLAETFLVGWRRRADIRLVDDSALPWLLVVANNVAATHRRRDGRHLRLLGRLRPVRAVPDHADDVSGAVDDGRRVAEVMAAVDALPPAQAEVVRLCLVGGVPARDAAAVMGVEETTVRSHLSRARARLRALLEENR